MKFQITNRWSAAVIFECELEARFETESRSIQLGAAVKAAYAGGANLGGADLRGANLGDANLGGAKNLPERWLTMCRDDVWAILSATPHEVPGLRAALAAGKVDGSTYEGECACLVGTIANVKGCNYQSLELVAPDSRRPAEQFFMSIKAGDTPDTNEFSKRALGWIDDWTARMTAAFGPTSAPQA